MLRAATIEDAPALAELVNIAGEGLPLYIWSGMAGKDEDPWSVGRARAARDTGSFSYRNATVVEMSGEVAACLVGYALPPAPDPIDYANMPAMFVPLQELENLAPSTWYVNVLASFTRWRNQGLGTMLLRHAEALARQSGASNGLSIIVADSNIGARRLYERAGYREIATRAMIKEAWKGPGSNWVLLVKNSLKRESP